MAEERITHARALDLIEEHIGEKVYFGFLVAGADDSAELVPVDHRIGPLRNLMDPAPPRLNPDQGFYAIGDVGNSYHLPPLTGSVHLRDNGIDFRIADTALIRIAWHGSSEIGDRRSATEARVAVERKLKLDAMVSAGQTFQAAERGEAPDAFKELSELL